MKSVLVYGAALAVLLYFPFQAISFGQLTDEAEIFSYLEDFEAKDPVEFWTSNGEHQINFKGITDERAFSGRRSFKLDVTLKSGSYHYWCVPLRVPCSGKLRLSARIFVEAPTNGSVGIGADFVYPPTHHSGCGPIKTFSKPTGEWVLQEVDLVSWGAGIADGVMRRFVFGATDKNVIVYLDRWGIFIYGSEGQRVVVYIDDVRIEGEVPKSAEYDLKAPKLFAPVREAFLKRVSSWRKVVESVRKEVAAMKLPVNAEPMREVVLRSVKFVAERLPKFIQTGYATPWEVVEIEKVVETLRFAAPNLRQIAAATTAAVRFVTFVPPKVITNAKILPTTFPIPAPIADTLSITACPGEYEPATFIVYALQDIKGLKVEVGELRSRGRHKIPATAVEVYVVKCWYQAGVQVWETGYRLLTPELLLKDDNLVKVDLQKKENYLKVLTDSGEEEYVLISSKTSEHLKDIQVKDADELLPVDIAANTAKQFWLTIHVPERAVAGNYEGKIKLTAEGSTAPVELKLRLRVLPFKLEPPLLRYSIYYRGVLTPDNKGTISSEGKSKKQYEAEMRNLKAHGVDYPTVYQGYDERLLRQIFQIRKKVGLPVGTLYTLGIGTGNPTEPSALEALKNSVRQWLKMAKEYGYDEVYIYGIDEATGELLKSQRPAWSAVREAGGKVFVACYKGTFEVMGDLLNLAVYAGPPDIEEAKKFHKVGNQIFCYANPQVGNEEPETYRRNFGLLLYKAGYDGAMDYAYQHSFNHIWNDFDDPAYRDHVFAYPTTDGVIDTIQWEGFREGVDDVRYLTTLLKAIEKAKRQKRKTRLAEQASQWVDELDPSTADLDVLRAKIIDWILKLR